MLSHINVNFVRKRSYRKPVWLFTSERIQGWEAFRMTFFIKSAIILQVRPFSCTYCEKTFASQGSCTIHERKHLNIRPYGCEECGKNRVKYDFKPISLIFFSNRKSVFDCGSLENSWNKSFRFEAVFMWRLWQMLCASIFSVCAQKETYGWEFIF